MRRGTAFFNRKAPQGLQWFRVENKAESDTTEVYIFDEIGGWWGITAQDFVDQITKITTPNIALHINSPGGEVFDGVAIYNALLAHKAKVTVYVDGLAASAASFIAQAGDKIVMSRGSTMMIHDGLAWCIGNEKDMLNTAAVLSKISDNIADIYADRAGGTVQEWRDLMREEVWYTAQEAVDAGLADEVAARNEESDEDVTNKWDLSIFAHKGRSDAPSPDQIHQKILLNRAKEAPVTVKAKPRAEVTDTPPTESTEPPATTTPETPATPAPAPEPGTGTTEEGGESTPPAPTSEPAPTNKVSGVVFNINGVSTSDPKAVQAHIDALEGFRNDTRDANRKSFCEALAKDKKISAAQLSGIETFALGLSNEQYEAWTQTWDVAPQLSILGQTTEGTTNHEGDVGLKESAVTDRVEVLKGIIAQHKMGGMDPEKIKATGSYKELVDLQPEYKL